MDKNEFFAMDKNRQQNLTGEALCNLIMFEDLAPCLSLQIFKKENLEVMKIVLGAYMNGIIN